MTNEEAIKRKEELFAPIHQQILMTDDDNDLLLLATNMLTSSMHIFYSHYGHQAATMLIDSLYNHAFNAYKGVPPKQN